ncbi:MAG TPA: (4Fe-4S)-binding protein [Lentisphaeria bacterium]|nr:MAG: (4Fe-4S)-binding protein [Lentisphaerae bacterium GWF2_50_93]HCE43976.1 (4Fe-4S)-binding protein [Lentisphaeria bacterium]
MSTDTGIKKTGKLFTVAVASGKGGTGKTTVAVSLALCTSEDVQLLDCDVEEPNAHIFINPGNLAEEQVSVPVPSLDEAKCTGCGKCNGVCAFNAIAFLGKPLFVLDLCHSCGLCAKACPEGAIKEVGRNIGKLETGIKGKVHFVSGCMDVGTAMSPPVIRAVKGKSSNAALRIIDCPPGTACSFVTSVKNSDFVLLVSEPTPFGLHDMTLAVKVIKQLKIPFGVLVNKSDSDDDRIGKYCRSEKIALLMRIPEDRRIAEAYSRGVPLLETMPDLKDKFEKLLQDMKDICSGRNEK